MELDEFMASPIWWQWWKKTCHKPTCCPIPPFWASKPQKGFLILFTIILYIILLYIII
jgi:hypothetical protein